MSSCQAIDKVKKLLALAEDQPGSPEGNAAAQQAGILMAKHGLEPSKSAPGEGLFTSAVLKDARSAILLDARPSIWLDASLLRAAYSDVARRMRTIKRMGIGTALATGITSASLCVEAFSEGDTLSGALRAMTTVFLAIIAYQISYLGSGVPPQIHKIENDVLRPKV